MQRISFPGGFCCKFNSSFIVLSKRSREGSRRGCEMIVQDRCGRGLCLKESFLDMVEPLDSWAQTSGDSCHRIKVVTAPFYPEWSWCSGVPTDRSAIVSLCLWRRESQIFRNYDQRWVAHASLNGTTSISIWATDVELCMLCMEAGE